MDALPPKVRETFWTSFGKAIPQEAKVSVSLRAECPKDFLDAMGKMPRMAPSTEQAFVIFVDMQPEANWAHDCMYVYVASDGSLFAVRHNWPPHCRHDMAPMERPE